MTKHFEGFILPILFIIIITIAAILGIIASVQTDNVHNNQTFTREETLEKSNRYLIVGYILYFVSVGCVIISLLTHAFWKESPEWLQTLLVTITLVTVIIGVVFMIIASNELKNIIGDIRSLALWSSGLGIAGIVLAIMLVYFRSVSYIREHQIEEEKIKNTEESFNSTNIVDELPITSATTIQTQTPNSVTTTTSKYMSKTSYPMLLE